MGFHNIHFNGRRQAENKAADFEFAILRGDPDMSDTAFVAVIRPRSDAEGWKKSYEIEALLEGGESIDDCVHVFWQFPELPATAAGLARHLGIIGLAWSPALQNEMDSTVTREIFPAPGAPPKPKAP